MFKDVSDLNVRKKQEDPTHHELQIWCADMWAVLWNGWKMRKHTQCHPNLNFSWGTSSKEEYDKCNIMHNAGVTNDNGFFYKGKYMNILPYDDTPNVNENTGSWYYWEWVKKVGQKTVLK